MMSTSRPYWPPTWLALVFGMVVAVACSQEVPTPRFGPSVMAIVAITTASSREANGISCGARYTGTIVHDYQGKLRGNELTFGRTVGLKPGQSIRGAFVWFRSADEFSALLPKSLQQEANRTSGTPEAEFVCRDLIPGYIFFPCVDGEADDICAMRGERIFANVSRPRY